MALAIGYGIIHDLVTAFLCTEYFTIGHPIIIQSKSPIPLALAWGIIATWWLALPLGLLLAGCNYLGSKPSLELGAIVKLTLSLIATMFGVALVAGILGYFLTEINLIYLVPRLAEQIPSTKHSLFLAAGWAHTSSYISATIGIFIIGKIILKKRQLLSEANNSFHH